jgi:thiol-disulfide isomerase/thioredoxin
MVVLLDRDNRNSLRMMEGAFADAEVGAIYNSRFVPVLLWDDQPGADKLFYDYGFVYYPALIFLSPEGDFLKKEAGYRDKYDLIGLADNYKIPQADRLAELRRAAEGAEADHTAIGDYLTLLSELELRNTAALARWLETAEPDAATFAMILAQDPAVESAPFRYLTDNADKMAAAVGKNRVETYIYNKCFDLLTAIGHGRQEALAAMKNAGYEYADALGEHLALEPSVDSAPTDADVRARIDRLVERYPVAADRIADRLWRQVNKRNPDFEEYVAGFGERMAASVPMSVSKMARNIANNYMVASADIMAANRWVDRYLRWSGDPNFDPQVTRNVKRATGEILPENYGQQMPDIALKDIEGNTVRVSDLRGEFVLIDFWASWCGPCIAELPRVKAAYEKVKGLPVRFVSITSDNNDEAWKKAVERLGAPWLQLSSKGTDMLKQYKVFGIPRIMILDPEGRLVADNLTGNTVEEQLRRLGEKYGWPAPSGSEAPAVNP